MLLSRFCPGGWVELDGSAVAGSGLDVAGGESAIRGFVIHSFNGEQAAGIRLQGPGGNAVTGNRLGTDVGGNSAMTNRVGIRIDNSSGNRIGGASPDDANVIGGLGIVIVDGERNEIIGNRIGLGADGNALSESSVGIGVVGGRGTRIGGTGGRGNLISSGVGILIRATSPVEDVAIEGNQIGLEFGGVSVGTRAQNRRVGILLFGSSSVPIRNVQLRDNDIAGHLLDVGLFGQAVAGTVVENNRIGLTFTSSGSLPAGISAASLRYGIRVDRAAGTRLSGNIVAGHVWDVLLSGTEQFELDPDTGDLEFYDPESPLEIDPIPAPVAYSILEKNTIGLNALGSVATGAESRNGVTVFGGAQGTVIRENIVAGHTDNEVWIVDGEAHTVAGNRLGTPDGIDRGSQTGLLIDDAKSVTVGPSGISPGNTLGGNAEVGIHLRGAADDLRIRLNQIGTDPDGMAVWPNGTGIKTGTADSLASSSGLRIEDNVIGGNLKAGIELTLTNQTLLQGNRVGVSASGLPLPNVTGVAVAGTPLQLLQNTIAHNTTAGIAIVGTAPVLVQGGPIYANGTGLGFEGLLYQAPPFPSPTPPLILRSRPDAQGKVTVVFIALESDQNKVLSARGIVSIIGRKMRLRGAFLPTKTASNDDGLSTGLAAHPSCIVRPCQGLQGLTVASFQEWLKSGLVSRQPEWSESIAVGSREFVEAMRGRVVRRCVLETTAMDLESDVWALHEVPVS